jgi:mannose-6-phosphate isomerase-like protein (cupin superfamily)
MPIVQHQDAPVFELPGVRFTGLTSPTRGSKENAVWTVVVQPGTPGTPHRVTREETFVAVRGRAVLEVDGVAHDFSAGSAFAVPAGSRLSLTNPGPDPFHAVAVLPVGGQVTVGDAPPFTPPWAA